MAAARIHNFAFFLLTFYFLKLFNQFESIMQNKPNLPAPQMNINTVITKDYENKRLADSAKTNPIKPNFRKARMNINSLITKDYRKKDDFAVRKNKPNSNPIPERPKMNENLFAAKVYENITTFRLEQNKPNQTQPVVSLSNLSQKGCVLSPMPKIFAAGGQFPHACKLAFYLEPKLPGFIMLPYFGVLQKDKEP